MSKYKAHIEERYRFLFEPVFVGSVNGIIHRGSIADELAATVFHPETGGLSDDDLDEPYLDITLRGWDATAAGKKDKRSKHGIVSPGGASWDWRATKLYHLAREHRLCELEDLAAAEVKKQQLAEARWKQQLMGDLLCTKK